MRLFFRWFLCFLDVLGFCLISFAVTTPTIDPTTYAVDATPKSVLVTFADGPDTRGFAWMTDTSVSETKLWVIEGSHMPIRVWC